jgi:hypothetical protein
MKYKIAYFHPVLTLVYLLNDKKISWIYQLKIK